MIEVSSQKFWRFEDVYTHNRCSSRRAGLRELGRGTRETGPANGKHQSTDGFREPTDRLRKTTDWKHAPARERAKPEHPRNRTRLQLSNDSNTWREHATLHRQPKYFYDSWHFAQRFALWDSA